MKKKQKRQEDNFGKNDTRKTSRSSGEKIGLGHMSKTQRTSAKENQDSEFNAPSKNVDQLRELCSVRVKGCVSTVGDAVETIHANQQMLQISAHAALNDDSLHQCVWPRRCISRVSWATATSSLHFVHHRMLPVQVCSISQHPPMCPPTSLHLLEPLGHCTSSALDADQTRCTCSQCGSVPTLSPQSKKQSHPPS